MTGQELLDFCARGDLDLLKEMLAARPPDETNPSSHDMLVAACKAKQPRIAQFLIQQYPETKSSLQLHEAAMAGGIPVYKVILDRYPELKRETFGHASDPIGKAVMDGDLEMLKFLLGEGLDINRAHFCYMPVLEVADEYEASEEMMEVLRQHGAPQELTYLWPSGNAIRP